MTRLLILILIFSGMFGCASLNQPQQAAPQNQSLSWDKRLTTLSAIRNWNLTGVMSIRQAGKGGTANLQWEQKQKNYHIALFGPLGSNSFELTGQPGRVMLAAANGKRATAQSPEQLLAEQTGWRLPVSNLYYWIRGIPASSGASVKKLDAYNHLILLQQDGWSIQYPRYTSIGSVDLPDKIYLSNGQLNVRIAVSHWSFQ